MSRSYQHQETTGTRRRPKGILRWIPVIVWVAAIFSVSSIPDLTPNDIGLSLSDKVAHLIEFAVLGILVMIAVWPDKLLGHMGWIVLGLGLTVAALDELWQIHVPGRDSNIFDWIADAVGFTVIWLAGRTLARARYRT
jgi:VanZ family protein